MMHPLLRHQLLESQLCEPRALQRIPFRLFVRCLCTPNLQQHPPSKRLLRQLQRMLLWLTLSNGWAPVRIQAWVRRRLLRLVVPVHLSARRLPAQFPCPVSLWQINVHSS